ncbi:hypothetical protein SOJ79_000534 [Cronobacter sakazakii]|nr:hypothetical protein [Cronobacter sakazakii]
MITISNEQAKDLRNAFKCWQQDYDPVEDKEQYDMFGLGVVAMDELLALRKEREKAETVHDPDSCDPDVFERGISACLVDIPNDAAEIICRGISAATGCMIDWHYVGGRVHIKALRTAPPAPPVADDSLPYDPQIAEYEQMMEAEQAQAGTASQQFESLAGKAVVPEGWKLVPAQPTQAMCDAVLGMACFTFNGDGAKRIYEAMLSAAPEPCK